MHLRNAAGLELRRRHVLQIVAHAWDGAPDEACGLLVGAGRRVESFVACRNADRSSRTFSIGPRRLAGRRRGRRGGSRSRPRRHRRRPTPHTHTEAYPSPTDVDKASNPLLAGWHWALVSLRPPAPVLRSYRVEDGNIVEEPIVLVGE